MEGQGGEGRCERWLGVGQGQGWSAEPVGRQLREGGRLRLPCTERHRRAQTWRCRLPLPAAAAPAPWGPGHPMHPSRAVGSSQSLGRMAPPARRPPGTFSSRSQRHRTLQPLCWLQTPDPFRPRPSIRMIHLFCAVRPTDSLLTPTAPSLENPDCRLLSRWPPSPAAICSGCLQHTRSARVIPRGSRRPYLPRHLEAPLILFHRLAELLQVVPLNRLAAMSAAAQERHGVLDCSIEVSLRVAAPKDQARGERRLSLEVAASPNPPATQAPDTTPREAWPAPGCLDRPGSW